MTPTNHSLKSILREVIFQDFIKSLFFGKPLLVVTCRWITFLLLPLTVINSFWLHNALASKAFLLTNLGCIGVFAGALDQMMYDFERHRKQLHELLDNIRDAYSEAHLNSLLNNPNGRDAAKHFLQSLYDKSKSE